MSQALIQQARTYLHEHGYAFWYDSSRWKFRLKLMGTNEDGFQFKSLRPHTLAPYVVDTIYNKALDIIGVPREHRKPLTPNPNL